MSRQFSETVRSFLAPIVEYLDDPDVSEIMVNQPDEIWIEREARWKGRRRHLNPAMP